MINPGSRLEFAGDTRLVSFSFFSGALDRDICSAEGGVAVTMDGVRITGVGARNGLIEITPAVAVLIRRLGCRVGYKRGRIVFLLPDVADAVAV